MNEFDAILTRKAKKLKTETPIIPMHRTMDGALNGYSLIKSVFDIQYCTESQANALDAMHEWIATPIGLAVTFGTSLLFTAVACQAGKDEAEGRESLVFKRWGDVREALQAGRNGFKAVRTAILTAAVFTTHDLKYTILPSSLGFGAFYMMNRVYMRWENDKRKKMLKENEALFANLMSYGKFLHCGVTASVVSEEPSDFKDCCVLIESPSLKFARYDREGKLCLNKKCEIDWVKNRYILYKDASGEERLYYAYHDGRAELIPSANIQKIKVAFDTTKSFHLSLLQLSEILPGVAEQHFGTLREQGVNRIPRLKRDLYYLIRAFNGLIDGLYLYLGVVLGVASFSPPIMLALTLISAFYCVLCIASRVYEEYQNQQQLLITGYKIELAKAARKLEIDLIALNHLALAISSEQDPQKCLELEEKKKALDKELGDSLNIFGEKFRFLRGMYHLSKAETILIGIKHSLPFYGALISFLFALAFIGLIAGFSIPPVAVLITVTLGVPIVSLGIYHAFLNRRLPPPDLPDKDRKTSSKLSKIVQDVKGSFRLARESAQDDYNTFIKGAYNKKAFLDWLVQDLQADPLSDKYYADCAEVARSFWAGLSKGRKLVEMLLNRWQQPDEKGHYQDTSGMYIVIIPVAFIAAIISSLNAFVKGLAGRGELKNEKRLAPDILDLKNDQAQFLEPLVLPSAIVASEPVSPPSAQKNSPSSSSALLEGLRNTNHSHGENFLSSAEKKQIVRTVVQSRSGFFKSEEQRKRSGVARRGAQEGTIFEASAHNIPASERAFSSDKLTEMDTLSPRRRSSSLSSFSSFPPFSPALSTPLPPLSTSQDLTH